MSTRGVLAAINRAAKAAERRRKQQLREAAREHAAAVRAAEKAANEEERLIREMERADAKERSRLEKEAKITHVESMEAKVADMNSALAEENDEIDSILAATLDVDDYVDLETLRQTAEHPPFDRADLESAKPEPELNLPAEPVLELPPEPKGIFTLKGRHKKRVAKAEFDHAAERHGWEGVCAKLRFEHRQLMNEYKAQEDKRIRLLDVEMNRYAKECAEREAKVAEANLELDTMIANLGYGTADAIQQYLDIVVSNSVYPDHFSVEHEFQFDPTTAELSMRVKIPVPSALRTEKEFKYKKSSDEITSTSLSQKALKDRYTGAVNQISLRTLHEVFEADRRGLVKTISVEVGTDDTNPATGLSGFITFVAVAASREVFMEFDLSAVVSDATLKHLGAAMSKNPYGLDAAKAAGVRKS